MFKPSKTRLQSLSWFKFTNTPKEEKLWLDQLLFETNTVRFVFCIQQPRLTNAIKNYHFLKQIFALLNADEVRRYSIFLGMEKIASLIKNFDNLVDFIQLTHPSCKLSFCNELMVFFFVKQRPSLVQMINLMVLLPLDQQLAWLNEHYPNKNLEIEIITLHQVLAKIDATLKINFLIIYILPYRQRYLPNIESLEKLLICLPVKLARTNLLQAILTNQGADYFERLYAHHSYGKFKKSVIRLSKYVSDIRITFSRHFSKKFFSKMLKSIEEFCDWTCKLPSEEVPIFSSRFSCRYYTKIIAEELTNLQNILFLFQPYFRYSYCSTQLDKALLQLLTGTPPELGSFLYVFTEAGFNPSETAQEIMEQVHQLCIYLSLNHLEIILNTFEKLNETFSHIPQHFWLPFTQQFSRRYVQGIFTTENFADLNLSLTPENQTEWRQFQKIVTSTYFFTPALDNLVAEKPLRIESLKRARSC